MRSIKCSGIPFCPQQLGFLGAFRFENCGPLEAFGSENRSLFLTFSHVDSGFFLSGGLGNQGTPISPDQVAVGREAYPDRDAAWGGGAELDAEFGPHDGS